jgi:AcrR family transcriptional regulator
MGDAQEVKELFIKVSDELFFVNGYDNVGVADICKKAGKAKGLFFYYFKKKDNIVKLILESQISDMSHKLKSTLLAIGLNGVEKMSFLMNALISKDSQGPRALYYFKDNTLPEWVDSLAHTLKDKYIFPVICEIVEEIAKEGGYKNLLKEQTEIIYLGISAFMHKNFFKMTDEEYYKSAVSAISQTLENAIGCPRGTIVIK